MPRDLEKYREYMKRFLVERYAKLKTQGLCVSCGNRARAGR